MRGRLEIIVDRISLRAVSERKNKEKIRMPQIVKRISDAVELEMGAMSFTTTLYTKQRRSKAEAMLLQRRHL